MGLKGKLNKVAGTVKKVAGASVPGLAEKGIRKTKKALNKATKSTRSKN